MEEFQQAYLFVGGGHDTQLAVTVAEQDPEGARAEHADAAVGERAQEVDQVEAAGLASAGTMSPSPSTSKQRGDGVVRAYLLGHPHGGVRHDHHRVRVVPGRHGERHRRQQDQDHRITQLRTDPRAQRYPALTAQLVGTAFRQPPDGLVPGRSQRVRAPGALSALIPLHQVPVRAHVRHHLTFLAMAVPAFRTRPYA
ncbi:hypothetical protein [Streptomyces sp. NPDC054837]